MADSCKAVFLSYASQDAEAARRICDALRAADVEVWFDQSELTGGDAWDQKIRRQIKECALFVPIISANTQARGEGYFRIEWRLAAQRTHAIAEGIPFLLPVVIDETPEPAALVPAEFREVQWTRLSVRDTPESLAIRIGRLLQRTDEPTAKAEGGGRRTVVGARTGRRWHPVWLAVLIPLGATLLGVGGLMLKRFRDANRTPPASQPLTEAQQLVARARQLYDDGDELNRENWSLAEDLLKRAGALNPTDASIWALHASVSHLMIWHGLDTSAARLEARRQQIERARALAPDAVDVQIAAANMRTDLRQDLPGVLRSMQALAAREPANWQVLQSIGYAYLRLGQPEDSIRSMQRAVELSNGRPRLSADLVNVLTRNDRDDRYEEAEKIIATALARKPNGRLFTFDAWIKTRWRGDFATAAAGLAAWPDWLLREDRGAIQAWTLWLLSKQPDRALMAVQDIQRDYLRDSSFTGPRAVLTARAHELAGHDAAAQADWRQVIQLADRELATAAEDRNAFYWKAWALARLGDRPAAQAIGTLMTQRNLFTHKTGVSSLYDAPAFWVTLGQLDLAVASLSAPRVANDTRRRVTRVELEHDPAFEPLRKDPRYPELLKAAPQPAPNDSGSRRASEPADLAPAKSVAVLPFANLSPDLENAFFADGVHEDVITNLAKIRDLKVISRTSTLAYRDAAQRNLRKIAEELGVAAVLEGSVRRAGNKVRVTAQLIDARTDQHLWAETYNKDLSDIFEVQAALAREIAGALRVTLTAGEKSQIAWRPTLNQEAYDLYLRARSATGGASTVARQRIPLLEKAVSLDPGFTLAHLDLADAHGALYWVTPTPERARLMKDEVDAAVRTGPNLPETRMAVGTYLFRVEQDFARALAEFKAVEPERPNNEDLMFWIGYAHRRLGHWSEAVATWQKMIAFDPRSAPGLGPGLLTEALCTLRRFREAHDVALRVQAFFPDTDLFKRRVSLALFELDGDRAAFLERERLREPPLAEAGRLSIEFRRAIESGQFETADRLLEKSQHPSLPNHQSPAGCDIPVSLVRSYVAVLRRDRFSAEQHAEAAIAALTASPWGPRQLPWVKLATGRAHAYAGRTAEALLDAKAAVAEIYSVDKSEALTAREALGQIHVVLGQTEEALGTLRELMTGPSFRGPNEIRHDPLWSRLKDDPRFEEILKSAKPL